MVFYMPGHIDPHPPQADGEDLTPRRIVAELDRFVIGQARAKRAVAVALRNRVRRKKLPKEMAEEVLPKNILLIGPTGVGKTEIARRLARLVGAPFLKVEASKFTEVGYVGRDVESMIRDMVDIAVDMVRQERRVLVRAEATRAVEKRILDLLLPPRTRSVRRAEESGPSESESEQQASWERSRETFRRALSAGELDERIVEVEITPPSGGGFRIFGQAGMDDLDSSLREMMPGLFRAKPRLQKLRVVEAREALQREEEERLIDPERLSQEAVRRVEESGILFLDEIDKIAGRESAHGPDVSRGGVQRDLLPVVEGTLVQTKHGMVRTDHVLFIAAGAFHVAKPSDLIPELQGRFPIRVELDALGRSDLVRILSEPENSLVRQYQALLGTDGIELVFTEDGIATIAEIAEEVNRSTENIGARRLHTILERVLEEISFAGAELPNRRVVVDEAYVRLRLEDVYRDADLSRFIL